MAIDTAAKRHSAMHAFNPTGWHVPLPDGNVDSGDRQTLCGFYRGIAAGAKDLVSGLMRVTFRALKPLMSFLAKKPEIGFTAKKPTITFHEEG